MIDIRLTELVVGMVVDKKDLVMVGVCVVEPTDKLNILLSFHFMMSLYIPVVFADNLLVCHLDRNSLDSNVPNISR